MHLVLGVEEEDGRECEEGCGDLLGREGDEKMDRFV